MTTRKAAVGLVIVCLSVSLGAKAAWSAGSEKCDKVKESAALTIIPAPNDPLGRVLGHSKGRLKAAITAFLTSLVPQPDGSLQATSQETWAVGPQDLLVFSAVATITPIAGQPIGTVASVSALTLIGGTGEFEGWSGELTAIGTGFNIFGPAAGAGSSYFDLKYGGTLCTAP